jgi:REP-associated tyrosine transposase
MPRPPRLHVEGGFYHVTLRGNHREPIFFCAADRDRFAELVAEVIERFRMRVHAYCWMTNHVHLLMQVREVPLGCAMQRIASRYARTVQKRRSTTDHLFERRHRAILIDADSYLLELIRYIHLNPVRAHLVTDPADYPCSGHRAYLGLEDASWLTTDFGLSLFDRELHVARQTDARFVFAGIGERYDPSFTCARSDEPRILEDDRFMTNLKPAWRPRDRTADRCGVRCARSRSCGSSSSGPTSQARTCSGAHRPPRSGTANRNDQRPRSTLRSQRIDAVGDARTISRVSTGAVHCRLELP